MQPINANTDTNHETAFSKPNESNHPSYPPLLAPVGTRDNVLHAFRHSHVTVHEHGTYHGTYPHSCLSALAKHTHGCDDHTHTHRCALRDNDNRHFTLVPFGTRNYTIHLHPCVTPNTHCTWEFRSARLNHVRFARLCGCQNLPI